MVDRRNDGFDNREMPRQPTLDVPFQCSGIPDLEIRPVHGEPFRYVVIVPNSGWPEEFATREVPPGYLISGTPARPAVFGPHFYQELPSDEKGPARELWVMPDFAHAKG